VLAIIKAEYPVLAQSYEIGPAPDPGTASLSDHGSHDLPRRGNPAAARSSAVKIHEAKVEPPLSTIWCIVSGVAVEDRSAEELLEDGSGPRRDVLVGEEVRAYLNCGRG
jgi:hypothetical protein